MWQSAAVGTELNNSAAVVWAGKVGQWCCHIQQHQQQLFNLCTRSGPFPYRHNCISLGRLRGLAGVVAVRPCAQFVRAFIGAAAADCITIIECHAGNWMLSLWVRM